MNDYTKRLIRRMIINSQYGLGLHNKVPEFLFSDIDPIKPEKYIKAHSFTKKDFSGGLTRLLPSPPSHIINYDFASLYPTR